MKSSLQLLIYLLLIMLTVSSCSDKAVNYYNDGIDAAADNDLDRAIDLWEKSLNYRSDDSDVYFNLGSAYFETGDFVKAEQNFRNSLNLKKDDHTAYYKLGRSLQKQGKLGEAKTNFKFAIRLKKNYLPPYLGMTECALSENQINTARKYASMSLRLAPGNIQANTYLADVLFRDNQYAEAYMQIAHLSHSTNVNLLIILGKIMYEKHMYQNAITILSKARRLGASDSEMFLYLGKSALKLERYVDSKNFFNLALFKNQNESFAWAGLGEVFAAKNNWPDAIDSYSKAHKLSPENIEIAGNFGIVLLKSGQYNAALEKLKFAADRIDNPDRILFYLGTTYMKLGENKQAEKTFRKFIATWNGDKKYIEKANNIINELK